VSKLPSLCWTRTEEEGGAFIAVVFVSDTCFVLDSDNDDDDDDDDEDDDKHKTNVV
jgi:hypothetical protein